MFRSAAAFDRMTSQMRRALAINAHERLAIGLLWDRGPMTMSELGAGIPLSRAAVTTLVDRLERAGLVSRGGDESDRRRTVVTVTMAGINVVQPLVSHWSKRLNVMREGFGDDWAVVRRFLIEMRDMTNEYVDELSGMSDVDLKLFATQPAVAEESDGGKS